MDPISPFGGPAGGSSDNRRLRIQTQRLGALSPTSPPLAISDPLLVDHSKSVKSGQYRNIPLFTVPGEKSFVTKEKTATYATDVQSIEDFGKEQGIGEKKPNIWDRTFDWWWWELGGIAASVALVGAILGVLYE